MQILEKKIVQTLQKLGCIIFASEVIDHVLLPKPLASPFNLLFFKSFAIQTNIHPLYFKNYRQNTNMTADKAP